MLLSYALYTLCLKYLIWLIYLKIVPCANSLDLFCLDAFWHSPSDLLPSPRSFHYQHTLTFWPSVIAMATGNWYRLTLCLVTVTDWFCLSDKECFLLPLSHMSVNVFCLLVHISHIVSGVLSYLTWRTSVMTCHNGLIIIITTINNIL